MNPIDGLKSNPPTAGVTPKVAKQSGSDVAATQASSPMPPDVAVSDQFSTDAPQEPQEGTDVPPQVPQIPLPTVVQPLNDKQDLSGGGVTQQQVLDAYVKPGVQQTQAATAEQNTLGQAGVAAATQENTLPFLYDAPDMGQVIEDYASSSSFMRGRLSAQIANDNASNAAAQYAAEALKTVQQPNQGTASSTGGAFDWVGDWLGKTFNTDGNRNYVTPTYFDKTTGQYQGNFPAGLLYGLGLVQNTIVGGAQDLRNAASNAYSMVPQWMKPNLERAMGVGNTIMGPAGLYAKAAGDWVRSPNRLNDGKSNFVEALRGAQYSFTDPAGTGVGIKRDQGFRVGAAPGKGAGFDVNPSMILGFGLDVIVGSKADDIVHAATGGARGLRGLLSKAPKVAAKVAPKVATKVAAAVSEAIEPKQLDIPFLPQMPKPRSTPRPKLSLEEMAVKARAAKAAREVEVRFNKANRVEAGRQSRNVSPKGAQLTIPQVSPLVEAVSPARLTGKLYEGTTAQLKPGVNAHQLTMELGVPRVKPSPTALLSPTEKPFKYAKLRALDTSPASEETLQAVAALRQTSDAQIPAYAAEIDRLETSVKRRISAAAPQAPPVTGTQQELQLGGQPLGDLEQKLQPLPNLSKPVGELQAPLPELQSASVGELTPVASKNVGEVPPLASNVAGELPTLPTYGTPMADLKKPLPLELSEVPLPTLVNRNVGELQLGTDVRDFSVRLRATEEARQLKLPLDVASNAKPVAGAAVKAPNVTKQGRQLALNLKSPSAQAVRNATTKGELATAVNQLVQDSPHIAITSPTGEVSRASITTSEVADSLVDNAVPGATPNDESAIKTALEAVDVDNAEVQHIVDAMTDDSDLEQLFLEVDRIGNKYQTPEEIAAFNKAYGDANAQLGDAIDEAFPDTTPTEANFRGGKTVAGVSLDSIKPAYFKTADELAADRASLAAKPKAPKETPAQKVERMKATREASLAKQRKASGEAPPAVSSVDETRLAKAKDELQVLSGKDTIDLTDAQLFDRTEAIDELNGEIFALEKAARTTPTTNEIRQANIDALRPAYENRKPPEALAAAQRKASGEAPPAAVEVPPKVESAPPPKDVPIEPGASGIDPLSGAPRVTQAEKKQAYLDALAHLDERKAPPKVTTPRVAKPKATRRELNLEEAIRYAEQKADTPEAFAEALKRLPAVVTDTPEAQALASVVNARLKAQVIQRVTAAAEAEATAAKAALANTEDIGRRFTTDVVKRPPTPAGAKLPFRTENVEQTMYHGTRVEGHSLESAHPILGASRSELGVGHYFSRNKLTASQNAMADSAANLPPLEGRTIGQPRIIEAFNGDANLISANEQSVQVATLTKRVAKAFPELDGAFGSKESIVGVYDIAAKALDEPTALEFQRHMATALIEQGVDGVSDVSTFAIYNPAKIAQGTTELLDDSGSIIRAKNARRMMESRAATETGSDFSKAAAADARVSQAVQNVEELKPLVDAHAVHTSDVIDKSGLWDDPRVPSTEPTHQEALAKIIAIREVDIDAFSQADKARYFKDLQDAELEFAMFGDKREASRVAADLNEMNPLLMSIDESLAARNDKVSELSRNILALHDDIDKLPATELNNRLEAIAAKRQELVDLLGRSPCQP